LGAARRATPVPLIFRLSNSNLFAEQGSNRLQNFTPSAYRDAPFLHQVDGGGPCMADHHRQYQRDEHHLGQDNAKTIAPPANIASEPGSILTDMCGTAAAGSRVSTRLLPDKNSPDHGHGERHRGVNEHVADGIDGHGGY